jgi:hypothetical protein
VGLELITYYLLVVEIVAFLCKGLQCDPVKNIKFVKPRNRRQRKRTSRCQEWMAPGARRHGLRLIVPHTAMINGTHKWHPDLSASHGQEGRRERVLVTF